MSTSGYVSYPIESNTEDLLSDAYSFIKSKAPDWNENDANLDTWILQVSAAQASDLRTLAQDVPDTIFQYFGATMMGIPPLDAVPAQVASTWTMVDTLGHFIPAGTQVGITDSIGVMYAFSTTADISIQAGQNATPPGSVTLSANIAGSASSGLGGNGVQAVMIDTLSFVQSVVLTGESSGGQDAELSSEYLDRLKRKLQRLSNRPVLATDFSLAALDIPGVFRAVALDGYNPANQSSNNERMVAVAAVDDQGQPIIASVKTQLQTYLDGQRETNFVVSVFDPTPTQIDVTFNVKAIVGYVPSAVQVNAVNSINDYLDPANWGLDPAVTDASAQIQTWVNTPIVYYNKIIQVLSATEGVDRVISMSMAIHGNALGTADITLPGAAPLTNPGTINGTATP